MGSLLDPYAVILRLSKLRSSSLPPRCNVADRLQQALVVEPIGPCEGLVCDGLNGFPRPKPVDDLDLEAASASRPQCGWQTAAATSGMRKATTG